MNEKELMKRDGKGKKIKSEEGCKKRMRETNLGKKCRKKKRKEKKGRKTKIRKKIDKSKKEKNENEQSVINVWQSIFIRLIFQMKMQYRSVNYIPKLTQTD